jgi:16S rRNA (cytosine967-C5)-methyltransferase
LRRWCTGRGNNGRIARDVIRANARRTAWEVLQRLERQKGFLDAILDKALDQSGLAVRDRSLVTELVYGVVRHQARLDWIIRQNLRSPKQRIPVRLQSILRLGAYQLLYLDRIPASASVNESVILAKSQGGSRIGDFVNAVLRAISRNPLDPPHPLPIEDPIERIAIGESHPDWLVRRWVKRFGPECTALLCRADNGIPPISVRANRLKTSREKLAESLSAEGFKVEPGRVVENALHLQTAASLNKIQSYREGWFYVQDEAAQLVSYAVDPQPGEKILDACAAPGGKTGHMAELMRDRGRILACDISEERLVPLKQNAERLGILIIRPRQMDFSKPLIDKMNDRFDRILVDAPCSGLGVLRRHPEGKWQKQEAMIALYRGRQQKILKQVAPLLKKGGVLVYSTCSTEPEENESVVEDFLEQHAFTIEDLRSVLPVQASNLVTERGFLNTMPNSFRMDFFFAARLRKD